VAAFDTQKLIAWLTDKWKGRPCPMCGHGSWSVQDRTFQLMEFDPNGGLTVGGPVIPIVPITCGNCGNTVIVNALISGTVEQSPDTEEAKK